MSALPLPKYGLQNLYLFPCYQTREEFRAATGSDAPPYNPEHTPKYWFDPKARDRVSRTVVYERVLAIDAGGRAIPGKDGSPMLEPLLLTKDEAATANIPSTVTSEPGTGEAPLPVPLRPLDEDEELFFDLFGIVTVKNKKLFPKLPAQSDGFTQQDRQLLQAIARVVGILGV